MNLIIDIGNTKAKLAVFDDDKIIKCESFNTENIIEAIDHFINKNKNIDRAIISNVSSIDNSIIEKKINLKHTYFLSDELKLPFTNKYESKKTLGSDRKALASAVIKHFSDTNTLIIDAGTCITIDFIDENGNYHGGSISPGIEMRYRSLNDRTANLPKLVKKYPSHITGKSTEDSIHSGIINGVVYEIREFVSEYQKEYNNINVILTGGDSDFLSKPLKISIFANQNFLLEGLNHILNLNIDN
ncbi:MAG: type III pantothenate kinase [Bacteroidota bacterium]|nr:type III pantothenate kinase [Bacteroidota bacterium]